MAKKLRGMVRPTKSVNARVGTGWMGMECFLALAVASIGAWAQAPQKKIVAVLG